MLIGLVVHVWIVLIPSLLPAEQLPRTQTIHTPCVLQPLLGPPKGLIIATTPILFARLLSLLGDRPQGIHLHCTTAGRRAEVRSPCRLARGDWLISESRYRCSPVCCNLRMTRGMGKTNDVPRAELLRWSKYWFISPPRNVRVSSKLDNFGRVKIDGRNNLLCNKPGP